MGRYPRSALARRKRGAANTGADVEHPGRHQADRSAMTHDPEVDHFTCLADNNLRYQRHGPARTGVGAGASDFRPRAAPLAYQAAPRRRTGARAIRPDRQTRPGCPALPANRDLDPSSEATASRSPTVSGVIRKNFPQSEGGCCLWPIGPAAPARPGAPAGTDPGDNSGIAGSMTCLRSPPANHWTRRVAPCATPREPPAARAATPERCRRQPTHSHRIPMV